MKVEIWFDYVCPFCYLGETKFEKALESFEHRSEVEIVYRSFQLNMNTRTDKDKDIHQVIADKYHISYEQAKANNDWIVESAAQAGLQYRFDILKLNNTGLAHEITHFAKREGHDKELLHRYFKEYFGEGLDIGDPKALFDIAAQVGLDLDQLKLELENGSLKKEVAKDEALARSLGIDSVPHFLIDGKYVVSGAQDPKVFLEAMKKAYESK